MKKVFSILLCCIFLLSMAPGKAENMEKENIAAGYIIVTPAKSNIKALINALSQHVADYSEVQTGTAWQILEDSNIPDNTAAITIGTIEREDVKTAQELLPDNGYLIRSTEDGGVMIIGANNFALVHAVDLFVAEELLPDGHGNLIIRPDLDSNGTLVLSEWEKAGATIANRQRTAKIKTVRAEIASSSSLASISGVHVVTQLSGEYSINSTRSTWNVATADLGIMCLHNGKLYFFFGDTLGGAHGKDWLYSNVAAFTSDLDYTDGISFEGYLTDDKGRVKPVTQGVFQVNVEAGYEYTRIPTGAISLNGNLYMNFMSVAQWLGDDWICNFGGIMKSADDGETWTELDVRWPGDIKFCQNAPVYNEKGGFVYVVGITGGRYNIARMMRVPAEQYEDFDAYEYLVGYDSDNSPIWQSGTDGLYSDFALIDEHVWEPCIMYSDYLGEWIITHKNAAGLRMFTAKEACGPYELTAVIPYPHDNSAGYYGVFMNPFLSREGGQKLAFLMSSMIPTSTGDGNIWEVQIMEMTLNKKES